MKDRIFSFGGGVQSTAALVLAAKGVIKHSVFIFSNVGVDSENPGTLQYINNYSKNYAHENGIELVEVQKTLRTGRMDTIWSMIHRTQSSIPIPVRMSNGAPGNRACTQVFKIGIIEKWLKRNGATEANKIPIGIGFTVDEAHRMHDYEEPLSVKEYPLIELGLRRGDCKKIIAEAGLPVPPKSSCFFLSL